VYRRSGLGAYPTDPYYDPGRPSWLPYWIDDPTESQNKAAYALLAGAGGSVGTLASPFLFAATVPGYSNLPGDSNYTLPPPPLMVQPPSMTTDPTGTALNPDTQTAAAVAASNAALVAWAAQQNQKTPVDNSSVGAIANCLAQAVTAADYANCLAGNPPGTPGIPSWVFWAGGIALGLVVFMNLVKR
jgi:hypothetical protein